ncbi:MAG TPA: MgtC/SapB family protein, partial [Nocardioidaceae bacterium]|nr:MgtC/SapB family protein [Nocardioidaceae bacterium]
RLGVATVLLAFGEPTGQGWTQVGELALAFALSALIGLERELRQKNAGLRTHTIVGVAAALIVMVSKYGFTDVLGPNVNLDPSRVAAQIVSGIGFIGGGLIFVRRDAVRGLTTAAVVWLTAAVGMAAGAGLPILALVVTAAHFVVVYGFTPIASRLPRSKYAPTQLSLTYRDGEGVLRRALKQCTDWGFTVSHVATARPGRATPQAGRDDHEVHLAAPEPGVTSVLLDIHGRASVGELAATLADIDGMLEVSAGDVNIASE